MNILLLLSCLFYVDVYWASSISTDLLTTPIDLTWGFDSNTIYWPGAKQYAVTKSFADYRNGSFWYSANDFCAGEHGGTHLDAPYHFNPQGWKVGDIPLRRLIVPGVMIEVSNSNNLNVTHLQDWVVSHGEIPKNAVILVKFGWSQFFNDRDKYLGIDSNGNLNFPGVSKEAASWIVNNTQVVGVGVDTASVDTGNSQDFMAHRIFSERQMYNLENVNIPNQLPNKGFMLYVMPMKITNGTGAPLRIIAVPYIHIKL